MINILLLAAGPSDINANDGGYPPCLTEIDGEPVIAKLTAACMPLKPRNIIYTLRKEDVSRHHLDSIVTLLNPEAKIVQVRNDARGAACSALLASEWIDNEDELLIMNSNELVDISPASIVSGFRERKLDAGTISFPSIHPRYSYVRLDEHEYVVEAAEKHPISRHATVGFYWYAHGKDFIQAAKAMIRKDANKNGLFYICPAFNEMILNQAHIGISQIQAKQYHPLKTERQWQQFEPLTNNGQAS